VEWAHLEQTDRPHKVFYTCDPRPRRPELTDTRIAPVTPMLCMQIKVTTCLQAAIRS